jgi:hypothetical protein
MFMYPVERIIVPLILCCVLVGSAAGQNPQAKHPKRQIRTAAGNARGQKPRIAQPKQQNQLPITKPQTVTREKYDPAKNETTIDVPSMLVFGEQLDGLRMFVSFSYPGRTIQTPADAITLILASTSAFSKYSDDDQRNLTAWADGESLDFGRMHLFYSYRGLGYVTEGMKVSVPAKTFAQIANAQQVKMKLGPAEFRLRDSQLIALRDLGRRADSTWK